MKTVFLVTKQIKSGYRWFDQVVDICGDHEKANEVAEKHIKLFQTPGKQAAMRVLGATECIFSITEMEVK